MEHPETALTASHTGINQEEKAGREMNIKNGVDLYKNFKFRLSWKGRIVAGFSESTAFEAMRPRGRSRKEEMTARRRKLDGLRKYPTITLKRGITYNADFADWARKAGPQNRDQSKLSITLVNERGQPVATQKIARAWASEFHAIPDLDAGANGVAIQSLKLEYEGSEQDEQQADDCCGKFCGIYRGVVISNIDPMGIGRIQVRVPAILDGAAVGWAMPCAPVNLPSTVGSALPPVGAGVWIQFEAGDVNQPVWTGCFWSGSETPPALRNPS